MPTEKQNLNTPEKGATDWHKPLNENFEQLDKASILQVPTVDDLQDYSPTDETIAFIERERELWAGTGSKWVRVAYLNQTPHDVYVQDTEPADAEDGDVWIQP